MGFKKKLFNYIEPNDMKLTLPLHIKLRYELWFATIIHQKTDYVGLNQH